MATGFPSARRKQAESAFCAAATSWAGARQNKELRRSRRNRQQEQRSPYKQTVFHTRIVFVSLIISSSTMRTLIAEIRESLAGKPSPLHGSLLVVNRHTVDIAIGLAQIFGIKTRPAPPPQRQPRPEGRSFRPPRAPRPAAERVCITPHPLPPDGQPDRFCALLLAGDTALRPERPIRRTSSAHNAAGMRGSHPRTEIVAQFALFGLRSSAHRNSAPQQPLNSFRSCSFIVHHCFQYFSRPLRGAERITRTCKLSYAPLSPARFRGSDIPSMSFRRRHLALLRSGRQAIARVHCRSRALPAFRIARRRTFGSTPRLFCIVALLARPAGCGTCGRNVQLRTATIT